MSAEINTRALVDAWTRVSDELKDEIGNMAVAAAETAQQRIRDAYPRRSGRLQDSVRIRAPRGWSLSDGARVAGRVVEVRAPHVHFIEQGIAGRRRVTPRPTFVPIAVEERQRYLQRAVEVMNRDRQV